MADAYWRYSDGRQQPAALTPHVVKRPRSDYELPSGHDLSGYYAREDDRGGLRVIRDTDSINASYDRYLRSTQMPSYGGESGRSMSGGLGGHHHVDDPRVMAVGGSEPAAVPKIRPIGVEGVQPEISLPPDASSTLFVEGLPANCTRREPGGDPLVLCFVDFQSPAHAATAMDALQGPKPFFSAFSKAPWYAHGAIFEERRNKEHALDVRLLYTLEPDMNFASWDHKIVELNVAGYKFDEHDRDSAHLRIQFARHHGARLERLLLMAVSVLLEVAIGQQIALNVKQRFFVGPTDLLSPVLEYSVVTVFEKQYSLVFKGDVACPQGTTSRLGSKSPTRAQFTEVKSGFVFANSLYAVLELYSTYIIRVNLCGGDGDSDSRGHNQKVVLGVPLILGSLRETLVTFAYFIVVASLYTRFALPGVLGLGCSMCIGSMSLPPLTSGEGLSEKIICL
ncbi:UNVERIFIED_CONTAM: RNA-binding protein 1 [Sesamum calycinum]|uniref:RNA-binding protein 1 n=1 Tax=Sesamum calycinum TaxID=2727403 RepID=A0AAW2RSP3_9LAMI